jgi:hypothetical protein
MVDVMGALARRLTVMPIGGDLVAGPTFERVELGSNPVDTLAALATDAVRAAPDVAWVVAPLLDREALSPNEVQRRG